MLPTSKESLRSRQKLHTFNLQPRFFEYFARSTGCKRLAGFEVASWEGEGALLLRLDDVLLGVMRGHDG